jgi:putative transposase
MNTNQIAAEIRLTHWAQVMQERKASGLSNKAYCESTGIHENVYYYWQRKLREAACTHLSSQGSEDTGELVPNGWTRLVPGEVSRSEESLTIEVGGCRVMATTGTNPDLLLKVCRTLKSLC